MAEWYWIVVPSVLTALTIRLDAMLIGPYFTFQSIVYGWEGVDGEHWYEAEPLRWAVTRRFAYPFLLGTILALSGLSQIEVGVAGFLSAGLLIWPAVFNGLPYGVSRRDWQVPAIYVLLLILFFGLSVASWYMVELMRTAANGNLWDYFFGLLRDWLITAVLIAFGIAFFRGTFTSLRMKQRARGNTGGE